VTEVPGGSQTSALGSALRDAASIAERIGADEAAADAERARLGNGELPNIGGQLDATVGLRPQETAHAVRHAAMLENGSKLPTGGTLYLTSQRLIHLGTQRHEVELDDIAESAVALERLLLLDMADGSDLAVEVDQPRLLRVQLAAARSNARERSR
jgi:hypothetical protein